MSNNPKEAMHSQALGMLLRSALRGWRGHVLKRAGRAFVGVLAWDALTNGCT